MKHLLVSGDLLVVNDGSQGHFQAAKRATLVLRHFSLRLENLAPLLQLGEIAQLQKLAVALGEARVYSACTRIAKTSHRILRETPAASGESDLAGRTRLLQIAAAILSEEFKKLRANRNGLCDIDRQSAESLENLTPSELLHSTVEDLALKLHCSRRQLNRLFQRHLGISVAALKMEIRLLTAASLLRDPNAKVINIAGECGFNHLGLFNTCFRKRFRTSPTLWRNHAFRTVEHSDTEGARQTFCPLRVMGLCDESHPNAHQTPLADATVTPVHPART